MGYSWWGFKELDMTEQLTHIHTHTHSHTHIKFTIINEILGLSEHPGLPKWCSGKESICQCRRHKNHGFDLWVEKIPWSRK